MVKGIGQICITVSDLEKMTQFYREILGLKFMFQASGMSFFDLGGTRLMLGAAGTSHPRHPASILYYRVEEIQAAAATLKERGISFEREPAMTHREDRHELWIAFFKDPEENVLALMSEVPLS